MEDNEHYLIDAVRDIPVKITQAKIKEHAVLVVLPTSNVRDMVVVTERPCTYWEPTPMHRFIFDDASNNHVCISPVMGQIVDRASRLRRFQDWMDSLYKFYFQLPIRDSHILLRGVQLFSALITLIVVITGFYIASSV